MILNDLLTMGIVSDNTNIVLKMQDGPVERSINGKWFEDAILNRGNTPVATFTWQSNGVLVVRLAGEYVDNRYERLSRKIDSLLIQHYISTHREGR